jgi:hypothetical protein
MPEHESDSAKPGLAGNSDAPRDMQTPRRPGQPGEDAQRRPGPTPLSPHPTGPNPPFDPSDDGGAAAAKHGRDRQGGS